MIKVTQVQKHSLKSNTPHIGATYGEVLVTEAKLVLVRNNVDVSNTHTPRLLIDKIPILISETEKIEVGDWALHCRPDLDDKPLIQCNESNHFSIQEHWNKVLALPEHFSQEQLQAIVDGKLKENDRVLVECQFQCCNQQQDVNGDCSLGSCHIEGVNSIKLNSSNHITIYPVEEKVYTKEQVIQFLKDFGIAIDKGDWDYFKGQEWFEQNVK